MLLGEFFFWNYCKYLWPYIIYRNAESACTAVPVGTYLARMLHRKRFQWLRLSSLKHLMTNFRMYPYRYLCQWTKTWTRMLCHAWFFFFRWCHVWFQLVTTWTPVHAWTKYIYSSYFFGIFLLPIIVFFNQFTSSKYRSSYLAKRWRRHCCSEKIQWATRRGNCSQEREGAALPATQRRVEASTRLYACTLQWS